MSYYPPAVKLGLTETETTASMPLGLETQFVTDYGIVHARYMQHGGAASIAAGLAVGYADHGGRFDTVGAAVAAGLSGMIAGIVPVSHTTGDYGWVVFRGPLTNGQFQLAAGVTVSSAAERWLSINTDAMLDSNVSTVASDTKGTYAAIANAKQFAMLRSTSTTISSGTNSLGIIDVLWK